MTDNDNEFGPVNDLDVIMLKLGCIVFAAGAGHITATQIQAAKDVLDYFGANTGDAIDDLVNTVAGGNDQALEQLNSDVRRSLLAYRADNKEYVQ